MVSNIQTNTVENKSLTTAQKALVVTGAALGSLGATAFLAKRAGYSLNPKRIIKTPLKDMALFNINENNKLKPLEIEEKEVLAMAGSSVLGGFLAGIACDKNNIKAKVKESITQIFGNVAIPVACVGLTARLYKLVSDKVDKNIPQIKKKFITEGVTKGINKLLKGIPNIIVTFVALAFGIFSGNKVTNLINEKIYHQKQNRKIETTDFAPHIDDICVALSLTNSGNKASALENAASAHKTSIGTVLGRIIPLALVVPGYETGCAREDKFQ